MALTNKQQLFIEEFLVCNNATEAARLAGYSKKKLHTNASKLLQNTTIAAIIKQRLDDKCMSAEQCLAHIADIATDKSIDVKERLKALELIGKAHGLFVDRQQVEMEHSLSDRLSGQISDALARGYDDELQD